MASSENPRVGSRATTDILSQTGTGATRSDFGSSAQAKQRIHPLVQSFYSNLEIMDYVTSQRINNLAKRSDNSSALHRSERHEFRCRNGRTPDMRSSLQAAKLASQTTTYQV